MDLTGGNGETAVSEAALEALNEVLSVRRVVAEIVAEDEESEDDELI
jgi:hypothetical protein